MSGQPNLFGETTTHLPRLGAAQQTIMDALQQGSLHDDEAGAILHARRGHHRADERCDYCGADGRSVLVALRRKALVKRRRNGEWHLLHSGAVRDAGPGELPDGY